ncbi:MAG: hypothetical protein PHX30_02415 [Candidatus Pacebacteria bacterium]|nr:hypothetical protein [Candidatus Paceibacterota bacterium]
MIFGKNLSGGIQIAAIEHPLKIEVIYKKEKEEELRKKIRAALEDPLTKEPQIRIFPAK